MLTFLYHATTLFRISDSNIISDSATNQYCPSYILQQLRNAHGHGAMKTPSKCLPLSKKHQGMFRTQVFPLISLLQLSARTVTMFPRPGFMLVRGGVRNTIEVKTLFGHQGGLGELLLIAGENSDYRDITVISATSSSGLVTWTRHLWCSGLFDNTHSNN